MLIPRHPATTILAYHAQMVLLVVCALQVPTVLKIVAVSLHATLAISTQILWVSAMLTTVRTAPMVDIVLLRASQISLVTRISAKRVITAKKMP